MIHVEQHGPVLAIRMARSLFGKPLIWTTAYWVDGLLIDSGPLCTASELVRVLRHVQVDQIAITHAHEDQIGGLAEVRRHYPHAPIHAFRRTTPLIEEPSRIPMQRYRRLIWGEPQPVADTRSYDLVDDRIETREHQFRVIETPGHTPDHICLFEPDQRWLFSGDAYIGGSDVTWPGEADLFGVVCSLRALASLRPERLFPSSGNVRRTPLPDLHNKIGYLVKLTHAVAELDATGHSAAEVVTLLFGKETTLRFWTSGHVSAANLVDACRSYNALLSSFDPPSRQAPFEDSPEESSDAADSSTSRSTDLGDLFR